MTGLMQQKTTVCELKRCCPGSLSVPRPLASCLRLLRAKFRVSWEYWTINSFTVDTLFQGSVMSVEVCQICSSLTLCWRTWHSFLTQLDNWHWQLIKAFLSLAVCNWSLYVEPIQHNLWQWSGLASTRHDMAPRYSVQMSLVNSKLSSAGCIRVS